MRFRILCIAYALFVALYVVRLTQMTPPVLNEARAQELRAKEPGDRRAPTPDVPKSDLKPYLLLIEADWSKSPTAAQVKSDLEEALTGASIPETLRGDLLKSGPRILFAEDSVEYYQPLSCAEFMTWLDKHKLIRKKLFFPDPSLKASEYPENNPAGFEFTLVDTELHPVAKDSVPSRPFVEFRERRKWQIYSTLSGNWIEVFAGIERVPIELGRPNIDWSENHDVVGRLTGRRAGESLFASGALGKSLQVGRPAGEGPDADDGTLPVIWLRAFDSLRESNVKPKLRIPDRIATPQLVHGNFPIRPSYEPGTTNDPQAAPAQSPSAPASASSGDVAKPSNDAAPSSAAAQTRFGSAITVNSDRGLVGSDSLIPRKESAALKALRDEFQRLDAHAGSLARDISSHADPISESDLALHRKEVRAAVKEAFVAGQKLHEAELAEFRERMQRLQHLIKQRSNHSEQIINRRVEDLLNPLLNWNEKELVSDSPARQEARDMQTPGSAAGPAIRKAPRRPFQSTVTVGVVSEVRDDGTVVVSCMEPDEVRVGEELTLSSPDLWVPGQGNRVGWIEITNLEDAETAIGKPFGLVRDLKDNRFSDRQPKPGDSVGRPNYEKPAALVPETKKADEPAANSSKAPEEGGFRKPIANPSPAKARRRPIPLSSDVGLISAVREDGMIVIACKEPNDVQVGEELILSWLSKEEGGTFKPAGWVTITSMENADTAIGKPFELPRVQFENRFVDRSPIAGDFVGRPIYEKESAAPSGKKLKSAKE